MLEPTQIIELSDSVFHRGIELERVFVKEGVKDLKLPKTISSGSDVERARCLLSTIGQDLEENGYVQKSSLKNEKNFAVVPNICRPTGLNIGEQTLICSFRSCDLSSVWRSETLRYCKL